MQLVKAQIYAGGRGKAGGVKLVHYPEQAQDLVKDLFGRKLITPQTGPQGLKVSRILVEEAVEIARNSIFPSLSIGKRLVIALSLLPKAEWKSKKLPRNRRKKSIC